MNYFTFGHRKKQFTLLLLILTISAVATDLYTPSFSAIAKGLSTTVNGVQWTISLFVFMLGISQVFYGPLSDFIGRKKVLILGFAIATLGSCLCVFFSFCRRSVYWAYATRFWTRCSCCSVAFNF